MTYDEKRAAILAAHYTIQAHCKGTALEGWVALLPGETVFKDDSETGGDHNYLGFFSCEEDLLDEVYGLIADAAAV